MLICHASPSDTWAPVAPLLPGWGDTFVTLMAGVIILNLLSGPPMFKAALVATGEARNMPGALLMSSKEADEYEQVGHGGAVHMGVNGCLR